MAHCPDSRKSAASNFLITLRASEPWGMSVRTAELQHAISISAMRVSGPWEAVVRMVKVKSAISFFDERAFGPRLSDVQTGVFELQFLPYGDARPDGWSIFPLLELGKNLRQIEYREASGRAAESPDGCKLDRTFLTQWRVRTERHVVRTDDAWSVWSANGMARRPDGWNSDRWASGRDGSIVQTADKELKLFWLWSTST
jgi:hypothetical protein